MRRSAEILGFALLAVAVHVLLMADWASDGAEAGGVGGDAMVTLAGATPQIETMVADWTRPPETQAADPIPQPQAAPETEASFGAGLKLDDAPQARIRIAALPSPEPDVPQEPRAETAPRPEAQPKQIEPVTQMQPPATRPDLLPRSTVRRDEAPNRRLKAPALASPDTAAPPRAELDTPPPPVPPKPRPAPEPAPKTKAKPAERSQPARAGAAPQKSAGAGGTAQAGNSGKSAVRTLSKGQKAKLVSVWGAKIRSQVERRKRYPSGTRARGQVVLKISVDRNGRLAGVGIRNSSGDARLDAAAVAAVRNAGRFPSAPKELAGSVFSFSLPVRFGR
ncbi:MAG: TonB family protein [Jhaorihella sp.]